MTCFLPLLSMYLPAFAGQTAEVLIWHADGGQRHLGGGLFTMWVTELELRSGEMDVKGWLSSLNKIARPRFSERHFSSWMHTLS